MSEIRVQIAVHFTWDPAKDAVEIPKQITNTIAVGEKIITEKIDSSGLSQGKKDLLLKEMETLSLAAKKTAKKKAPESKAAEETGEQGSLL